MNDEEFTLVQDMMVKLFGDRIADPDVFPLQFKNQVKMAKFELSLTKKTDIEPTKEEDV